MTEEKRAVRPIGKRDFARQMRRNPSFPEIAMWKLLKGRALGYTFNRQVQKAGYILDFYCPQLRICVEVDGAQHGGRWANDLNRDTVLARLGIRTVRISASLVMSDPDAARSKIVALIPKHDSKKA